MSVSLFEQQQHEQTEAAPHFILYMERQHCKQTKVLHIQCNACMYK